MMVLRTLLMIPSAMALRDSLPEANFSESHLPTGDVQPTVGTHHDPLADEIAALDLSAYGDLTADVTDPASLSRAMAGARWVFHCAADYRLSHFRLQTAD